MSRVDQIDAEIVALKEAKKLAVLEAAFVKKKKAGTHTRKDKNDLSAAREKYRLDHRIPTTSGAAPAPIGGSN